MTEPNAEHEQIAVELRRAVVGTCDVSDFMSWIERSAVSNRDVTVFLKKMKWKFRKFRESNGYFQIPIGDGIIAILDDAPEDKPVNVFHFVTSLWELSTELSQLADEQQSPRPGGSRLRITAGIVYRTEEPPLPNVLPIRAMDFIGEPLNLGSRLLQVRRDVPALITEMAIEAMTPEERKQLILEPVEVLAPLPRGVRMEELKGLAAFHAR